MLAQHHSIDDPETHGSYTVKRYESEKDAAGEDGSGWRHRVIRLIPENPEFVPVVLNEVEDGDVSVIAEMIEVLEYE